MVSRTDPNMGLYYFLLHFWTRLFGDSEAALRSLTVLLGGLAIPVIAVLGKRLFGRTCGLVAGLLLALSPFFVQYEQTARSYALLVLLVLLSSYFFVAALQRPSGATLTAYALSSTLAIYAHYFAALVLLVQLATLLAVKRREAFTGPWLATGGAVLVLCAPEIVFAHRAGSGGISWIHVPTLGTLVRFPGDVAGYKPLAALLIVLACYGLARAAIDRQDWKPWFLAGWLVGPVLLVFVVSRLGHPLFVTYYLIIVLPAFLLLAALGVARLPRGPATIAAVVLLVALSAVGMRDWYRSPSFESYRAATRYILAGANPADGIVGYPAKTVGYGIAYYEALNHVHGPKHIDLRLGQSPSTHPPRIWLVVRNSNVSPQEDGRLRRAISSQYAQLGPPADFTGITVILYRLDGAPLPRSGRRRRA
ncbi:MAG TPA: glycosyltransferase family 39 protein [Solirubrobacteraceae bacterium]|nr:glycosyltransferase family 39 protein [Solirubrobacteraceae bacterium]